MSEEIVFFVYSAPDGGFEARASSHSIFTQADTMEQLKAMVEDAVACHFGDGETLPTIRLMEGKSEVRRLGSAKGEFTVPDDFNDPLPKEIEDLFYE